MAPHCSTLAWKIPWMEEPGGLQSMGSCEESDMTERLHFHFSLSCIREGNGNPLQCSCLKNPRDGEAWCAAICGVAQSRTQLTRLSSSSNHILEKKHSQPLFPGLEKLSLSLAVTLWVCCWLCKLYMNKPPRGKTFWRIWSKSKYSWFLSCHVLIRSKGKSLSWAYIIVPSTDSKVFLFIFVTSKLSK